MRDASRRVVHNRALRLSGYVLAVPVIVAAQRRMRRSLRWRLAGSHVSTVLLSVLTITLIGSIALAVAGVLLNPFGEETGNEAHWVASAFEKLEWTDDDHLRSPQTSAILAAMATGKISPNVLDEDLNFIASIGTELDHVRSLSIVTPDLHIASSSDPALIGQPVSAIGFGSTELALQALAGSTDIEKNSTPGSDQKPILGAYPMMRTTVDPGTSQPVQSIAGALVINKSARSLPEGGGLILLALKYVGTIALALIILVGIPAIPVGIWIGLRRARAISRPVTDLAAAADAISERHLDARVFVAGEDELAMLARHFNSMADRLEESMTREATARGDAERSLAQSRHLVANVSHELRTPVALIRAHLESLSSEPEQFEEYTRIALREADRLEALVNDLFQLARVESQGIALSRDPFDAGSAAREAVESLAEPARRDAGIVIKAVAAAGDLTCLGDRSRVVQVLQNLMRNAIRFTPEGGIILVDVRSDNDTIAMAVQDTGRGIPAADLPHVFDRFYRSEQSRNRSHGGAGLGLAIARQLVESMGGTITVQSQIGEGTRFTVRLPCPDTGSHYAPSTQPAMAAASRVRPLSNRIGQGR